MSISDLAAGLDAVLDEISAARALLGAAADLIDEVAATLEAAVDGSSAPDALHAVALFVEAQQGIQSLFAALQAAEDGIREYRAYLVGQTTVTGPSVALPRTAADRPPVAPPNTSITVTPERIEQLRRELPPPVVPNTGQKTHGRWIGPDGNVHAEVSGNDEKSREALWFFEEEIKSHRIPRITTHVEIKLAAHMRKHRIRSTVLVINHTPCDGGKGLGCVNLVSVVLPPGYTMTVHCSDGVVRQYKGGGTSRWVP